MAAELDELILEFQSESKTLIGQLLEILEGIEEDYGKFKDFEQYGQVVDRIMGTAKSLAQMTPDLEQVMGSIGKYSELCKAVSYKASQVGRNDGFHTVVVAVLLDATEMLQEMVANLSRSQELDLKNVLSRTFLDRLHWLSQQFSKNLSGTLQSGQSVSQQTIDDLMKALGV